MSINPSQPGWLLPTIAQLTADIPLESNSAELFDCWKAQGLWLGHWELFVPQQTWVTEWSDVDLAKVGLLKAALQLYQKHAQNFEIAAFLNSWKAFYAAINGLVLPASTVDSATWIEQQLHLRLAASKTSTFGKAKGALSLLLPLDVLAYERWLLPWYGIAAFAEGYESLLFQQLSYAFQLKGAPTETDRKLIAHLEAGSRFGHRIQSPQLHWDDFAWTWAQTESERKYLFETALMVVCTRFTLTQDQHYYLDMLAQRLQLPQSYTEVALRQMRQFFELHQQDLVFLNDHGLLLHMVDQSTDQLAVLLKKNKRRLAQELAECKELVYLMRQSTQRDLTEVEKRKVREQWLDICKAIPSLALFMLPGGSLLLPVLMKYLPTLLPSSFQDNVSENRS